MSGYDAKSVSVHPRPNDTDHTSAMCTVNRGLARMRAPGTDESVSP